MIIGDWHATQVVGAWQVADLVVVSEGYEPRYASIQYVGSNAHPTGSASDAICHAFKLHRYPCTLGPSTCPAPTNQVTSMKPE